MGSIGCHATTDQGLGLEFLDRRDYLLGSKSCIYW
jgi:hypothetical protein